MWSISTWVSTDVEDDASFQPSTHQFFAKQRLLLLVTLLDLFDQALGQFIVGKLAGVKAHGLEVDSELAEHFGGELSADSTAADVPGRGVR